MLHPSGVMLSAAKHLARWAEMLRCAQHDRAVPSCRILARRERSPESQPHRKHDQSTARHAGHAARLATSTIARRTTAGDHEGPPFPTSSTLAPTDVEDY